MHPEAGAGWSLALPVPGTLTVFGCFGSGGSNSSSVWSPAPGEKAVEGEALSL